MGSKPSGTVAGLGALPGDCLAKILTLATTREACTLSCVSKDLRSAADSDLVWENFLPSDNQQIVNRSIDPSSVLSLRSKKEIYRHLCCHPLLIDGGRKTYSLEKRNGAKCYTLSAKDLEIAWSFQPMYWQWGSLPKSRFEEVAVLTYIWRLEIRGRISTSMLSKDTTYAAYLVFDIMKGSIGLDDKEMEVSFGIVGDDVETRFVCLEPAKRIYNGRSDWRGNPIPSGEQYPMVRKDGWIEVELGQFDNEKEGERELEMGLKETSHTMKKGLIVEGIEIRPKRKRVKNNWGGK